MKIQYIAEDGTLFDAQLDCILYERKKAEQEKERLLNETRTLSNTFLRSVGFDVESYKTQLQKNRALGRSWIIFDKSGTVKGLKTCGGGLLERDGIRCDFRYVSGDDRNDPEIMENWLRKQGLYGHALGSFADRNPEFYQKDMLGMLKILGWEVQNGALVNNAWQ